jgi:histidinol phosphatase-like PHP family hydrolase
MITNSRRQFLGGAATALVTASRAVSAQGQAASQQGLDFPIVDYHVHLNAMTLDQVAATSKERGIRYGVVEHAGTKENDYPIVLKNDAELQQWMAKLDPYPVYKGVQAEWIDWMPCFSKDVFAQLDYVLTDAMTVRDANGKRIKAFGRDYDPGNDAEAFMKMYVDWMVEILEREPLDIFAHPTWIPRKFNQDFDKLWTEERMRTFSKALNRTGTACEIDCGMKLPKLAFLKMAKEEGVTFSFGSNSGGRTITDAGYCVEMAKALGLTRKDMFVPAPRGRKPIQRRKLRV